MSKRRKWAMIAACVVLGILLFTLLTPEREPSYQGKTLSRWLEICAYENGDDDGKGPGAKAIRTIGTNALPYLVRWVSYDSSRSQLKNSPRALGRKLPKGAPASLRLWVMEDRNETRAQLAGLGFDLLGEQASSAIPELTTLMNNYAATNSSIHASHALAAIGNPAIPALSAYVANTNLPNRAGIISWLATYDAATNDSIRPTLLGCLNDPDIRVASSAAFAFWRIAEKDRSHAIEVMPALTNCLASTAKPVKLRAIQAIGAYGTQANEAVPLLMQITADADEMVREAATNAILQIAPEKLTNGPAMVLDPREPRPGK